MLAKRTGGRIQIKHTCQQPYPTPERRFCAVITPIHALLGRDPVTHDNSVRQIERRQTLSDREFWDDFVAAKRPVIVAGAVKDWPALSKWKPEYLQSRLAGKTVNVTTSSTRVHNPYEKGSVQKISFDEAVRAMLSGGPLHYYIMQVPIQEGLTELSEDIRVPHFISNETLTATNLWFGPGGNITPAHYDHGHNMMAQVVGCKNVALFDSKQLYPLYPLPATSPSPHISRVNVHQPDLARFPKFSRAVRLEGVLEPGDALFIPVYWWHCLEGVGVNISVNFWWKTPLRDRVLSRQWARFTAGSALKMIRRRVRRVFHC
jgi:hypothetical protein